MAYTDYLDTVQKIYIGYYGRPADPAGLIYWASKLDAHGGNQSEIIDAFASSDEATTLWGTIDSTNISTVVDSIYTALFGRVADAAGNAYYVDGFNAGTFTAASIMLNILDGAQGEDLATVNNKVDAATLFTNTIDADGIAPFQATYSGDADALAARTWLTDVTWNYATVPLQTAVTAFITASIADSGDAIVGPAAGSTFTLTTGSDVVNGTSGDDTITGELGTMSGAADEIIGSAGTDTLTVKLDTAAAPVMAGVETVTLVARGANASFDLTNASGVETINVQGITNFALSGIANSGTVNVGAGYSADVTLVLAANTATAQALTVNLNDASGTDIRFTADSSTTAADTLTLNAETNWINSGATNFSGVEVLTLKGAGNVELNLASANHASAAMSADAMADLTAINAGSLSGALTLTLDTKDINISGGAGNDTFNLTANWNTNDTIVGGAGTDTVNAIMTGGYIRPIMSGVENLNLLVNSTAATADFRDIVGVTAVDLLLGTGLVIDKATTSIATINVNSSDSTANVLTVGFGTAAVASDVTLNLGMGTSILNTASPTATGMGIGTITMSGNSGSLTIKTDSTAKYTAAAIELNHFTAVTLNATGANLVVDGVVDVNTAQTLTMNAGTGKTLHVSGNLSANSVTTFAANAEGSASIVRVSGATTFTTTAASTITLNAAGNSALVDFSGMTMSAVDTLTINAGGVSAAVSADTIVMGQNGSTAGSGAVSMDTINISAMGDVVIGALAASTAVSNSAISLTFNVAMQSTAASVAINGLGLSDVGSAATASEQDVTFNISGTGAFTLNAGSAAAITAIASSNVTYHVDASNLASGSNLVIDLRGVNDTDSVASAVFGAASGSYVGVDGVDNIEFGAGAMTVNGGLGNDIIDLTNAASGRVEFFAATTGLAGLDTLQGAGAGDVLLFAGSPTALAATGINSGVLNTGTATNTGDIGTASFTALSSAVAATAANFCNIYTSNGDTIIEVWNTTAGTATGFLAGTAAADFVRVTLSNKDFTAITAAFQLNTTGSGLSITLL